MKGITRNAMSMAICAAALPLPSLAVAQGGLEEVVVSAQRVTSDLQSTPISLAVFGEEDLLAL